jgi:hypothetical protein
MAPVIGAIAAGLALLGIGKYALDFRRFQQEIADAEKAIVVDWASIRDGFAEGLSLEQATEGIERLTGRVEDLKAKLSLADEGSDLQGTLANALDRAEVDLREYIQRRDQILSMPAPDVEMAQIDVDLETIRARRDEIQEALEGSGGDADRVSALELAIAAKNDRIGELMARRAELLEQGAVVPPDEPTQVGASELDLANAEKNEAKRIGLLQRRAEHAVASGQMTVDEQRAQLVQHLADVEENIGAQSVLHLQLSEDLLALDQDRIDAAEQRAQAEMRLTEAQRDFELRTGKITLDERLRQMDELIAAESTTADQRLAIEQRRFALLQAFANEQIREAGDLADESVEAQVEALNNLKTTLAAMGPEYAALFEQIDEAIVKAGESTVSEADGMEKKLDQAGRNIGTSFVQGIIDGSLDAKALLMQAMNVLVKLMITSFTGPGGLAIFSPSKVSRGWGMNVGLGLVEGMDSSVPAVTASTNRMVAAVTNAGPQSARAIGMAFATGLAQSLPAINAAAAGLSQGVGGGAVQSVAQNVDLEELINNLEPEDPLLSARKPELQRFFAETIVALKDNGMVF